jgi:hypothetical protein
LVAKNDNFAVCKTNKGQFSRVAAKVKIFSQKNIKTIFQKTENYATCKIFVHHRLPVHLPIFCF